MFHCKLFTTTTKEFTTTLDPVFDGTGLLILGQEQDSFGGGFDKFQSFSGKISQFNVFQRFDFIYYLLFKSELMF